MLSGHREGVKGIRVDVSFLSPNPPDGTLAAYQSLYFHHHC